MSHHDPAIYVLVSACLLGRDVRYDGGHCASGHPVLQEWAADGRIAAFCPEVAGGLNTPRRPAEIVGGDGHAVLDGLARVVDCDGVDVTEQFIAGAHSALHAATRARAKLAVLKSKSPSCGRRRIYDGSFSGTLTAGQGVTAALLSRHGIEVFDEHQFDEADALVDQLSR
ncbi:MAG: DUF523 domain-containing protein [Persicimonas sp.]